MYNEVLGREYASYKMREAKEKAEHSRYSASHKGKSYKQIFEKVNFSLNEVLTNLECYFAQKIYSHLNISNSRLNSCKVKESLIRRLYFTTRWIEPQCCPGMLSAQPESIHYQNFPWWRRNLSCGGPRGSSST